MFALKGHHKWKDLPQLNIFGSKYEITPKGLELATSLWKAWFKLKTLLFFFPKYKDLLGVHTVDSIWWLVPQVDFQDEKEALRLHKLGIKTWGNLWDGEVKTWISRAPIHF